MIRTVSYFHDFSYHNNFDLAPSVKLMVVFFNEGQANTFNLPRQKWIYLKDYVYGAPDPKPPANAMADCSMEVDPKNISWVEGRSELIQNVTHWDWPCNQNPTTGALYPR